MDTTTIPALITALGTAAVPIGGAVAWLASQAQRHREEIKAERNRERKRTAVYRSLAEGYRLQLARHGIDPIPFEWPREDEDD
jgi:siroheme synthase (precorrin-2 oxidase/ferrochelatase)